MCTNIITVRNCSPKFRFPLLPFQNSGLETTVISDVARESQAGLVAAPAFIKAALPRLEIYCQAGSPNSATKLVLAAGQGAQPGLRAGDSVALHEPSCALSFLYLLLWPEFPG